MRPRPRDLLALVLFVGAVGLGFWHQRHHEAEKAKVVLRVIRSAPCGPTLVARLVDLPEIRMAEYDKARRRVVYERTTDAHPRFVRCARHR